MRKIFRSIIPALPTIFLFFTTTAQTRTELDNAYAFAKAYGYVKYFYPGDEAQSDFDWDRFAIYGQQMVRQAKTKAELKITLEQLFTPFVALIQIVDENETTVFDTKALTPPSLDSYQVVTWQHFGVGSSWPRSWYLSGRTNRPAGYKGNSGYNASNKTLFKEFAKPGEYCEKSIGSGLKIIFPYSLYGTKTQTYPVLDSTKFRQLVHQLSAIDKGAGGVDNIEGRLGAISIYWNLFQHFYVYFEEAGLDWNNELIPLIQSAYNCKNKLEFYIMLKEHTARLKDGHVQVAMEPDFYYPTFQIDWIEDQIVVTKTLVEKSSLQIGDIITEVNGTPALIFWNNEMKRISAATPTSKRYRTKNFALGAPRDSLLVVKVKRRDGKIDELSFQRSIPLGQYHSYFMIHDSLVSTPEPGIMYFNAGGASIETIKKNISRFAKAKAIICDVRSYPKNNHVLLQHLLTKKDTASQWMQVPLRIYPDRERLVGWVKSGFNLPALKPTIKAKVIFIVDGQVVSYGESYMAFVEHYKLGTIIGETTAGTNGNMDLNPLPGNLYVSYTGMKVYKPDGSRHHGIGITPSIQLSRTIKAVQEGRDEYFEKALELAREAVKQSR